MTTLAERAAAAAGRTDAPPATAEATALVPEPFPNLVDPMADYEPGDDDPDMVPVHIAWLRVRKDVRGIAKREQYNGGGTRFNFRGVDTVVNTFGPVTLRHGVSVLPVRVDAEYRDTTTSKGNKMRECTVRVSWLIVGPKGDTLSLQTQGEALDSADKGTAKAQSVALRVLLLTGGLTPTHDKDPDADRIERGEAPVRTPASYRDEALEQGTSRSRMVQINAEVKQHGLANVQVVNEVGDEETLGALIFRAGAERFGGGS